jgi:hypothetical protein
VRDSVYPGESFLACILSLARPRRATSVVAMGFGSKSVNGS